MRSANAPASTTLQDASFRSLAAERERAASLFGIDVEASFTAWMEDMLGEERAEALRERIRANPRKIKAYSDVPDLIPRERQCLSLMACGYTREESGAILHLSMETVAQYLKQAYSKLRTTNMAHATVVAAMIGELDAEIIRDHAFRAYELPGLAAPRRPVAA